MDDTSRIIGYGYKHTGRERTGDYIHIEVEVNGEQIYLILFTNREKLGYSEPDYNVYHSHKFRK